MNEDDNKAAAIEMIKKGVTPAEISKKLGINSATIRSWKSRIAPTETLDNALQNLEQQNATLETELQRTKSDLKQRETALQDLKRSNETLTARVRQSETASETSVQQLETVLREVKQQNATLETALQVSQQQNATLETQVQQTETVEEKATYDKTALFVFCVSLVVINALVIMPSNFEKTWDIIIGSAIVCFLAPFVEYQYSSILIEIWGKLKDKEQRQGVLKHLYKE